MVSRRRMLQLGVGALAATAGCLDATGRSSPDPVGDAPSTTPGDVPEWAPDWTLPFDDWRVPGLDASDGLLYATLNRTHGPSAVAAVDTADRSVRWLTESTGEAVGGSHAAYRNVSRGQWGVTIAEESVYAVAGPAEERRWSAVHALDRASGERRWSVRRDRELAVAGVADGIVVATGLEFFPGHDRTPISHQTPEEPLTTVVYGLDADTGGVRWTREFVGVEDVAAAPDAVYVAAGNRLVGLGRDGSRRFRYDHGPARRVSATAERVFYLAGEEASATLHGVAPSGDGEWQREVPVDELLLDGDRLYAGGDAVVGVEADGTVAWRDDDYGQWLLLDPDRDSLYTRAGVRADAATAYDADGSERWTFDPPSTNAWPEAATGDALVTSAITGDHADEPFLTVYAVDSEGRATAALGRDTVFDAAGLDGTVYLADGVSNLVALSP